MRRRLLLGGAATMALMVGLGSWLLGTPSGGTWLLARALGPALSFDSFAGSLIRGPVLTGITYRDARLRFSARRLALRWHPFALLSGRLHVELLEGEGLVYEQLGEGASQPKATPPGLPLDLRLDRVQVRTARIKLADGEWTIDRLQAAASAAAGQIHLSDLSLAALGIELKGDATLALAPNYPYSAHLSWRGDLPDLGKVRAAGTIRGDLAGLTFDHRIAQPFPLHTHGRLSFAGGVASLDADGDWKDARWPLTATPSVRSPAGRYTLRGPLDHLEVKAQGGLQVPDSPPLDLELTGLATAGAVEDLSLVAHLGEARAEARGQLSWAPDLHWSASVDGKAIDPSAWAADWPGRIDLAATVQGGFGTEGLWSDIGLTDLSGRLLDHPLEAQGQARMDAKGVSLARLALSSGPSRLDLKGRLNWAPQATWKLDLEGTDLDPSLRWPDWPGRLSLRAQVAGGTSADGPWSEISLEHLTGRLNGQALDGRGRAAYRAGRLDLDDLSLQSGPNLLKAQGTLAERLDLKLDLAAPDLSATWPRLGGAIQVQGSVTGKAQAPQIEGRVTGKGLHYQETRLATLAGKLLWGPDRVAVSLDGQGLSAGGVRSGKLSLKLQGRPQNFETRIAIDAVSSTGPAKPAALFVHARLNGGWKGGRWQGKLDALDLASPGSGHWSLDAPSTLTLAADRIDIQQLCLRATDGSLCAAGNWTPSGGHLSADARSLPLALLKPWLPQGTLIQGSAAGQAKLGLSPEGPSGTARLDLTAGRLSLPLGEDQKLTLPFGAGSVRLDAGQGALDLDANLPLADKDRVGVRMRVGRPGAGGARPLSCQVEAGISDLSPAEMLVPQLSEIHGALSAQLGLAGTLEHPVISGEATIANGSARVPALGVALDQIQLSAKSRGTERLDIEGSLRSGKGRVEAKGNVLLDPRRGWPLDVRIKGTNVQAVRLPEALATASPDLRIRSSQGALQVEGSLVVPQATIQIRQLPKSAVSVSSDEVVVGGAKGQPSPTPLELQADVELRLGDQVRFSGFGLKGGLEGKLELSATDGRTLAQGIISVKDGRYKAYGQDLKIERGRLIFAGPPTSPSLDVRATRRSEDDTVTAILDLTGSLREPIAQVSSDPPLSREEAMAYLLTGRSVKEGGGAGNSVLISQALISGSLGRSQTLLEGVATGVGLDQLQVKEGATLHQSSLLLGKYLSPDLYISYAVGLFDPQGALVLRYRLTKHLRLEAQSGQHQGADLIYGFERD